MTGAPAPLRVAFVGGFSACFVEPVRARLTVPCDLVRADERDVVARLPEVDVLVRATRREPATGPLGGGLSHDAPARRARAFDMEIRAIRREPRGTSAEGLAFLGGPESLNDLLPVSDYLAVTLALTPESRGLLGARELSLMKRSAMIVKVARGEVIDEDAL